MLIHIFKKYSIDILIIFIKRRIKLIIFFQPNTVDEVKILLSKNVTSNLLAGGTDLMLDLKKEKKNAECIIDLGKLSELKNINEEENQIVLGSMVTFSKIKECKSIKNNFNSLIECAKNMGSPQIRNMATIGGNIVNAGSAADIVPCIISLHGILIMESISGTRQISCEEYFKNYSRKKIKKNEVLTKVIIPKKNRLSGYYKLGKRNSLAIARVNVAISLKLEENIVKNISICLGAVGRFPFRAIEFEKSAAGKNISWLFREEALKILENQVYNSIKGRKTMPFKKEAIKGVYKEALRITIGSNIDTH